MKKVKLCAELIISVFLLVSGLKLLIDGHGSFRSVPVDGPHVRIVGAALICCATCVAFDGLRTSGAARKKK